MTSTFVFLLYKETHSMTHSPNDSCAFFLFLAHFDVICDLLLNRPQQHGTYLFNLFVK